MASWDEYRESMLYAAEEAKGHAYLRGPHGWFEGSTPEDVDKAAKLRDKILKNPDNKLSEDEAHNVAQIVAHAQNGHDFTAHMLTGKAPDSGYQISVPGHEYRVPPNKVTAAGVEQWMMSNKHLLSQPNIYMGGWTETDDAGNKWFVLEPSENFQGTEEEAIKEGQKRDQIAIWDNKNGKEIATGGSGGYSEKALQDFINAPPGQDTEEAKTLKKAKFGSPPKRLNKYSKGKPGEAPLDTSDIVADAETKAPEKLSEKEAEANLEEFLKEAEQKGQLGNWRNWYRAENRHLQLIAKENGIDPEQFIAAVAATSPRMRWEEGGKLKNINAALKSWEIYNQYKDTNMSARAIAQAEIPASIANKFKTPVFRDNIEKAIRLYMGEHPDTVLTGAKTRSFYNNLRFPGQTNDATMDTWMAKALVGGRGNDESEIKALLGEGTMDRTSYRRYAWAADRLRAAVDKYNAENPNAHLTYDEGQAIIWMALKDRTESGVLTKHGAGLKKVTTKAMPTGKLIPLDDDPETWESEPWTNATSLQNDLRRANRQNERSEFNQLKANVAKSIAKKLGTKHDERLFGERVSRLKSLAYDRPLYIGLVQGKPEVMNPVPGSSLDDLIQKKVAQGTVFPIDSAKGKQMLREEAVSKLISLWAGTSNDHDAKSLAIQEAIRQEFGLQGTAPWRLTHDTGDLKEKIEKKADLEEKIQKEMQENGQLYRDFVRAMYDNTQADLKRRKITSLVLWRGSQPVTKGDFGPGLENVPKGVETGEPQEVALRPASSWSLDNNVAQDFALSVWEKPGAEREDGAILGAVVPADRVLATPFTGFGCGDEEEVVVLGGRDPVKIDSVEAPPRPSYKDLSEEEAINSLVEAVYGPSNT